MNKVLDTNAVLYLLGGRVAEPFPKARYFISVITEIELLSYPLLNRDEELKVRAFLADVTVVGLTQKVKQTAIKLRMKYRLKLPDAIIASTALTLKAELFTNDLKLLAINDLSVKVPVLK